MIRSKKNNMLRVFPVESLRQTSEISWSVRLSYWDDMVRTSPPWEEYRKLPIAQRRELSRRREIPGCRMLVPKRRLRKGERYYVLLYSNRPWIIVPMTLSRLYALWCEGDGGHRFPFHNMQIRNEAQRLWRTKKKKIKTAYD